jgi:periplasmic protein CpxP/Spy
MNSSSRSRRLIVIIIILLFANIGILAFFLWPKGKEDGPPKGGYGVAETLKREVGLDSVQSKELLRLRSEHWKKMKPLFEDLQESKNNFYALLKSPETPDSVINNAAALIGERQRLVDIQVFQHFRNSRLVCTPQQRPKYDSLVQIIIKRMSGQSRGNGGNRKRD